MDKQFMKKIKKYYYFHHFGIQQSFIFYYISSISLLASFVLFFTSMIWTTNNMTTIMTADTLNHIFFMKNIRTTYITINIIDVNICAMNYGLFKVDKSSFNLI
jgi:hypothetical protein